MRRESKNIKSVPFFKSKIDLKINPNKLPNNNPECVRQSPSFGRDRNSKSLFITEHDSSTDIINKVEKTKLLWRKDNFVKKAKKTSAQNFIKESQSIKSWRDLYRVKANLHIELMKRKSKQQLFEENLDMIDKIENTPPKVQTWNDFIPKKIKRQTSSNSSINLFEKNMEMIKKIQDIPPVVDSWNTVAKKLKSHRTIQRQISKEKIFQQNMGIISKIQNIPPKVSSWCSLRPNQNKRKKMIFQKKQDELFQKNIEMINKIENTPPKVQTWVDIKWLKKKTSNLKNKSQKNLNITKIKEYIRQAEQRLKSEEQKQLQIKKLENKRYKTLPSKMNPSVRKKQPNMKNFTARVQGVKCSVDCWGKNKPRNNLPPLKLMEMKQKQRIQGYEKLRSQFMMRK